MRHVDGDRVRIDGEWKGIRFLPTDLYREHCCKIERSDAGRLPSFISPGCAWARQWTIRPFKAFGVRCAQAFAWLLIALGVLLFLPSWGFSWILLGREGAIGPKLLYAADYFRWDGDYWQGVWLKPAVPRWITDPPDDQRYYAEHGYGVYQDDTLNRDLRYSGPRVPWMGDPRRLSWDQQIQMRKSQVLLEAREADIPFCNWCGTFDLHDDGAGQVGDLLFFACHTHLDDLERLGEELAAIDAPKALREHMFAAMGAWVPEAPRELNVPLCSWCGCVSQSRIRPQVGDQIVVVHACRGHRREMLELRDEIDAGTASGLGREGLRARLLAAAQGWRSEALQTLRIQLGMVGSSGSEVSS